MERTWKGCEGRAGGGLRKGGKHGENKKGC